MVAAKIREQRKQRGWSARQLAEHCGLTQDVIQNIENGRPDHDGRRRRAVTVDEVMAIANGLDTVAVLLLPRDYDFMSAEKRQRMDEAERQRQADAPRREADWKAMVELPKVLREMQEFFRKIPDGAVIAVERDGKLVPVEEPPRLA